MAEVTAEALTVRSIRDTTAERPSYFMCGRRDIPALVKKAEGEAAQILAELAAFYRGDIGITIKPRDHVLCYSIGATLTVNGEVCREYDTADLCFLEINNLMLKEIIRAGAGPAV